MNRSITITGRDHERALAVLPQALHMAMFPEVGEHTIKLPGVKAVVKVVASTDEDADGWAKVGRSLCDLLLPYVGEDGTSESAVDVLTRILAERNAKAESELPSVGEGAVHFIAKQSDVDPAALLYGFMAWLSTRKAGLAIGAGHDASPVPPLIVEFLQSQELSDRPLPGWKERMKPYPPNE